MAKILEFEGSSDDTFGCDELDYDNCASGDPIVFRVLAEGVGLVVSGEFAPEFAGGWRVGVATYDPEGDDLPLPEWPIRIVPGKHATYSPRLIIEAPDDAEVELAGQDW